MATGMTNRSIPCVDLYEMARARRRNWDEKARNTDLIRRELLCHQYSIGEYYRDISTKEKEKQSASLSNSASGSDLSIVAFNAQPHINAEMRRLILEFIVCCHSRLYLSTPTLFETFSLLDRYTSRYVVKSSNYQLIALTCLWISSKFFDPKKNVPSLNTLGKLCCFQYKSQEFKNAEFQILKSLNWEVGKKPTPDVLIDLLLFGSGHYLENDFYNVNDIKNLSIMLCELTQFDIEVAYLEDISSLVRSLIDIAQKIEELFHYSQQQNSSSLNNPSIKCLISECWLQSNSNDIERILGRVLKNDYTIPSCIKLKYNGLKLNKLNEFIRWYKMEKATSKVIPVSISSRQQESEKFSDTRDGHFGDSKASVMNTPCSITTPAATSNSKDHKNTYFYNMPLTPATPVSLGKRPCSSIASTDIEPMSSKRLCR